MKFSEKEYLSIKEEAHRLFLQTPVGTTKTNGIAIERYFVTMCYTKAVMSFLQSKGLLNEAAKAFCKED